MRVTLHETVPGEFDSTPPDVLQAKLAQALRKAAGPMMPAGQQHRPGGDIDLPGHLAEIFERAYAARAQRMWQDVAERLQAQDQEQP